MTNDPKPNHQEIADALALKKKDTETPGLAPAPENDIPNDLDSVERERQRQRINDLARDNQHGRGQDEDERSGQGNQGGHGDRGGS
jgi:hypothetical protein